MNTLARMRTIGLVILSVALAVGACAGAASPSVAPATSQPSVPAASGPEASAALVEPEVQDLLVATIPVAALTPAWLAEKQGYFRDEGFDSVEFSDPGSSAQIVNLITAGQLHFGLSTYSSALQAIQEGFDIVNVSTSDDSTDGTEVDGRRDGHALLVKADSGIERPADLEGRVVGVSSVPGLIWAFAVTLIREDGGDPEQVRFVEVPYSGMVDALLAGTIDAAGTLEPGTTIGLARDDIRAIAYPYVDVAKQQLSLGGFFTTGEFAQENPVTVKKFVHAVQRAMDDMNNDEAFAREQVIEYTGLDPEVANAMWLPPMTTKVKPETIEYQMNLMIEQDMLSGPVDWEGLLWQDTHFEETCDVCYHGYLPADAPTDHHTEGETKYGTQ